MLGKFGRGVAVLWLGAVLGGCAVAAAGAAGAAAGIYFTSRGVGGVIEGSLDDVVRRTEIVYRDMGITIREREVDPDGDEIEIKGNRGGMSVDTNIRRETATTSRIEVEAQKSAVEWDQDYARDVLNRIIQQR